MYLKKVEGPRAVTLPDGTKLTRGDLPPPGTQRWVASRKAAVVKGVAFGLITKAEAIADYELSEEEFDAWQRDVRRHGVNGLRATALQKYRQP